MTTRNGYLAAHGPTMTVDLVVSNHRELADARSAIVDYAQQHGVENAAPLMRALVRSMSRAEYTDLRGVDINKVDFHTLIRLELNERAIFNKGKEQHAN